MADRSTMLLSARAESKARELRTDDAQRRPLSVGEGMADDATHSDVRRQLDAVIAALGAEEVRVLALLAHRLLEGQHVYGHLNLGNDPRDLEAERGDEIADALIYGAMAELKRILARPKENR